MNRMKLLSDAAKILAAPLAVQTKFLEDLGVPENVDELVLQFDDIAAAADDMLASGELTSSQYRATRALDGLLSKMSGQDHRDLWNTKALASSLEWAEVRKLADSLLTLMSDC